MRLDAISVMAARACVLANGVLAVITVCICLSWLFGSYAWVDGSCSGRVLSQLVVSR